MYVVQLANLLCNTYARYTKIYNSNYVHVQKLLLLYNVCVSHTHREVQTIPLVFILTTSWIFKVEVKLFPLHILRTLNALYIYIIYTSKVTVL